MKSEEIEHQHIAEFESRIEGSFKTDSESLKTLCPISEGTFYKVRFEKQDIGRIFLCWADNLKNYTKDESYCLSDTNDQAKIEQRVTYWLDNSLDLSLSDEWSPVFIGPNHDSGAMVAIDGNHRLMAHYLTHGCIEGVHAYLFVHHNTVDWRWFPYHAKELFFKSS